MIMTREELIKLQRFDSEVETLYSACKSNLTFMTVESDELFDIGTVLCKPIDPIVERGLIATSRLFMSRSETIEFSRIANIVARHYSNDKTKLARIREYKKEFSKLVGASHWLFDIFENVRHLHFDVSNEERLNEYIGIIQSCRGPFAHTEVCRTLDRVATLLDKFNAEFVKPLINSG